MSAMLKTLISILTSKVTGFWGFVLRKVLEYGGQALLDAIEKMKRDKAQSDALKKVEEDVKNKTPRSDETKKHEKDWMNS